MFSFVARIRVIAEVKPRPAIKPAGAHTADVIRRQIFTDLVPLVIAHPEPVAVWAKGDPDGVANSPCVNFSIGTIGVEIENTRAFGLGRIIGILRTRPDRDL